MHQLRLIDSSPSLPCYYPLCYRTEVSKFRNTSMRITLKIPKYIKYGDGDQY